MVGWFYVNDEVAAPVRMLETDTQTGVITIEVASNFIRNRSMLRGETIIEFRSWTTRRAVRCLGAEQVGGSLMIEAVDVGASRMGEAEADDPRGAAEDWLIVDGRARCQIHRLRLGDQPESNRTHCLFHVALTDWRDLRIGEGAVLASVGISMDASHDNDGSITPLLHAARDLPLDQPLPRVELIRLRERQRYTITPIATDWGDETTLVVSRVLEQSPLAETRVGMQV